MQRRAGLIDGFRARRSFSASGALPSRRRPRSPRRTGVVLRLRRTPLDATRSFSSPNLTPALESRDRQEFIATGGRGPRGPRSRRRMGQGRRAGTIGRANKRRRAAVTTVTTGTVMGGLVKNGHELDARRLTAPPRSTESTTRANFRGTRPWPRRPACYLISSGRYHGSMEACRYRERALCLRRRLD